MVSVDMTGIAMEVYHFGNRCSRGLLSNVPQKKIFFVSFESENNQCWKGKGVHTAQVFW